MNTVKLACIGIVVLVVGLLVGSMWSRGYNFHEVTLNGEKDVLRNLEKRVTLRTNTTSQDGLLGVVGLVLIVDQTKTPNAPIVFDRSNVIPTLRPASEAILVSPIDKKLYEGTISNTLKAGGSYTSFSGDLSTSQTAEMVVMDELYMGYRDRTKIPFEQLYKLKPPEGKAYYFVEGATITSTTYRTYDEVSSTGTLDGTAFKANGKVFASNKGFGYSSTLSIDVFDVQALRATEAGTGDPTIPSMYRQHVKGELDKDSAKKFVDLLRAKSDNARVLSGATIKALEK